jgi:N-acetylglucosamine-6-phosphate deacetylase
MHPAVATLLFHAAPQRAMLVGLAGGAGRGVAAFAERSGCGLAAAVRCATENVAEFMGERQRGKLEVGRRADFVVMDDEGVVMETWVGGVKVWEKKGKRGEGG